MKTGIIGLPQVGKTSLFKILTKAHLNGRGHANPRGAHMGIARVPDERLDRLAALYNPRRLMHTAVEYVDVAAFGQEALKETAYVATLRGMDALAHVMRAFDDPAMPHLGGIGLLHDIRHVELDLMLNDLGQIEKRLERLEKDLKNCVVTRISSGKRQHSGVLVGSEVSLPVPFFLRGLDRGGG